MVNVHNVSGYETFKEYIKTIKSTNPVHVIYSGSKLPNGQNWCPDCIQAEPFIEKALEDLPKDNIVIHVEVGDRAFWKDSKCPFRTDPLTKLNVLPTIARWGTQKRLEGDDCLNTELLKMLLNDEDDD